MVLKIDFGWKNYLKKNFYNDSVDNCKDFKKDFRFFV